MSQRSKLQRMPVDDKVKKVEGKYLGYSDFENDELVATDFEQITLVSDQLFIFAGSE